MSLKIPANDHGRLYIFEISRALAQKPSQIPSALGLGEINPEYIDVVTLADLSDRGIGWYLETGYDVTLSAKDAAILGAKDGTVLMVMSRAFGGTAATLTLPEGLAHLTTLDLPGMQTTAIPMESAAAKGVVTPPDIEMEQADHRPSRLWLYVLIVLFGFFALMAWRISSGNV